MTAEINGPDAAIVCVRCEHGEARSLAVTTAGLFVVFRAVGPRHLQSGGPNAQILARGAGETQARLGGFSLGVVNQAGVLCPVHETRNPWRDIDPAPGESAPPHTWQLSGQMRYEGCLIRHSSPSMARAILQLLNDAPASDRYIEAGWRANPRSIVRALDVRETGDRQDRSALFELVVPPDPGAYLPKGDDRYQGWVLFPQMPFPELSTVGKAVAVLKKDLAALRYPLGPHNDPYDPGSEGLGQRETFDLRLAACLDRFQRDAALRRAFKPSAARPANSWAWCDGAPAAAVPAVAWTGENGHEPATADRATVAAIVAWRNAGLRNPGVMLVEVSSGHEKQKHWTEWLRVEAAVALLAWRALARAMGCPYGVVFGHGFRDVLDSITKEEAGAGKAPASIHKSGLAIDLAMIGNAQGKVLDYSQPIGEFPIRYEGEWIPGSDLRKAEARAQKARKASSEADAACRTADAKVTEVRGDPAARPATRQAAERTAEKARQAATKAERAVATAEAAEAAAKGEPGRRAFKLRWRLYAHSRAPVFDPEQRRGAIERIRDELASVPASLDGEIRRWMGIPTDASNAALGALLAPIESAVADLLALCESHPQVFVSRYFRESVHQWRYNPYAADGGATGDEVQASRDLGESTALNAEESSERAARQVPTGVRAFVNLTRLAWCCGLCRIGSGRAIADPSSPGRKPMRVLRVHDAFGTIVGLLDRMGQETSAHREDEIRMARKGFKLTRRLEALDLPFMKRWAAFIGNHPRMAKEDHEHPVRVRSPEVTLLFHVTDLRLKPVEAVFDALASQFGDSLFLLRAVGSDTGLSPSLVGEVKTGLEWAGMLEVASSAFRDRVLPGRGDDKARMKPRVRGPETRYVTLQPIFDRGVAAVRTRASISTATLSFFPDDTVSLPEPGVGRALEWWHYQHRASHAPAWGGLLEAMGLSTAILGASRTAPATDAGAAGRYVLPGVGYSPAAQLEKNTCKTTEEEPDNGEPPRRRMFFALYYTANDQDGSFLRAAKTWMRRVTEERSVDPDFDLALLRPFGTLDGFINAWVGLSKAAAGANADVLVGAVFSHASWTPHDPTDIEGLEFVGGTLPKSGIEVLTKLPWDPAGELHLIGCNTGNASLRGWAPAAAFARRQGVRTWGEPAFAFFSRAEEQYEVQTQADASIYLRSYRHGRNLGRIDDPSLLLSAVSPSVLFNP